MKTKIGPLLERIEKAREVMGTKPLQKLDKILLQAEKLLITAAKATGIRVDDIEGFPDEEDTETPEEEDTDESEEIDEESDDTEPAPVSEELPAEPVDGKEDKLGKIKDMYGKLPAEKQNGFKAKMGEKFNMLGL